MREIRGNGVAILKEVREKQVRKFGPIENYYYGKRQV